MSLQDLNEGPGPGRSQVRLCSWRVFWEQRELLVHGSAASLARANVLNKLLPFMLSSPAQPGSFDLGEKVQSLIRN